MLRRLGYRGVCTLLGLVAGWVPMLLHGPIPIGFAVAGAAWLLTGRNHA